jgi:hypothetical protein
MKLNPIITGSTGMVGEGVLLECLNHPKVDQILIINRKPGGISHPKLREIIHADFFNLTPIEPQPAGYNACFFCLGVSSVGINKDQYKHITYDLTLNFAQLLAWIYPLGRALYPAGFCTLQEVARAMINAAATGYPKKILEVKDIVHLAKA